MRPSTFAAFVVLVPALAFAQTAPTDQASHLADSDPIETAMIFDGARVEAPLAVSVPSLPRGDSSLSSPRSGLSKVGSRGNHKLDWGLLGASCKGSQCFLASVGAPVLSPLWGGVKGFMWGKNQDSYFAIGAGVICGTILGVVMIPIVFIEGLCGGISSLF